MDGFQTFDVVPSFLLFAEESCEPILWYFYEQSEKAGDKFVLELATKVIIKVNIVC